jgi:short-subunit dehydrogenase
MIAMPSIKPVVLITGASSGIGAGFAELFAAKGHELFLVARRQQRLETLAGAIVKAGGKPPHVMAVDLARSDAGDLIAAELIARNLEPEIVVNSAGFGLLGPAENLDRNEQLAMIAVNARILTDLSLRWIDSLARHQGGVLNVGSVTGFKPGPGMAVYHATKACVLSFSEALHEELKARGVRVTLLCPGPVITEFRVRSDSFLVGKISRGVSRVVRDGYNGLMAGRRLVVPGFSNQALAAVARLLPRRVLFSLITGSGRIDVQSKDNPR